MYFRFILVRVNLEDLLFYIRENPDKSGIRQVLSIHTANHPIEEYHLTEFLPSGYLRDYQFSITIYLGENRYQIYLVEDLIFNRDRHTGAT